MENEMGADLYQNGTWQRAADRADKKPQLHCKRKTGKGNRALEPAGNAATLYNFYWLSNF